MEQATPTPNPHTLIPPLLACLPTSFASSKPPPAFLPLLSPILRQRLQIHTSTGRGHDSWIRLLCWDASKTDVLKEIVDNANFEPHPSSGELEVGEIDRLSYKRFDKETLKAQIPLNDWSLTTLYVWCTGSEDGNAWKLAELLPYDSDLSHDQSWSNTISEANEQSKAQTSNLPAYEGQMNGRKLSAPGHGEQDDGDDDYWAQYDKTPERTPGQGTPGRKEPVKPQGSSSDADYYAQYGSVQPAMDNYDPDEHNEDTGESSLGMDNIQQMLKSTSRPGQEFPEEQRSAPQDRLHIPDDQEVIQPVPASPSSRAGSDTVARLEETADRYSASEVAIKQHISYSVKSMYRLAKGAGISRQEFEGMVQRELETLSILDRE